MRWVFNPSASSLTLTWLISKQNPHTHIFRLRFAHMRTKEAALMCKIPALVLPFLWELCWHKLCSSLLHSPFFSLSKRVSWFIFQWWHRAWYWICAMGSSVAAMLRHLGLKFQGCPLLCFARLTVLFPRGCYLLSSKLWPSWLQRKAWKHGILQHFEVWLMTF